MPQTDLNRAAAAAQKAIQDDDLSALTALVDAHPALLSWREPGEDLGDVLLQATTSYANFPGAEHEDMWNRRACAAFLLDRGALMDPRVYLRIIATGAHQMMALFERRGLLPNNLRVAAALGDPDRVRGFFGEEGKLRDAARPSAALRQGYPNAGISWPPPDDTSLVLADAFLYAARLGHADIATFLLGKCIDVDPDLGAQIDAWQGREAFVSFLLDSAPDGARFAQAHGQTRKPPHVVWQIATELRFYAFLAESNLAGLVALLDAEPFVLETGFIESQRKFLEVAAYSNGALPFIDALLDRGAAILSAPEVPESRAISYAVEYGHRDYVPSLAKVWPVPQDLPHAAGLGDFDRVKSWFDANGEAVIPDPMAHNPFPDHQATFSEQDVLDRALAWAVQNGQYPIADFLLDHGADINTRWGTHEPASILHECAAAGRLAQVRYLVRKGIERTITDNRFFATAQGWAEFCGQPEVAAFLETLDP